MSRRLAHPRIRGALAIAALSLWLVVSCSSATPSSTPTAVPVPTATATPEATATPIPLDDELLGRRFTVLVVGLDSSAARRAGGLDEPNTDALMVVSISADKSQIALLSLPRDTVDLPMPDGSIYRGKVNGIADTLGIEALRGAMATLLDAPIDRYIAIDMDDFTWMVDAVGGIDVEVEAAISDPQIHLQLEAGPAHLDGVTALGYSRTRVDMDYGRAARQQQVILALVREWLEPRVGSLVGSLRLLSSLETDISLAEIPTLIEIGRRSTAAEVNGIVLQPPRFSLFVGIEPNSSRGWVMIPNLPEIRAYAESVLSD